MKILTVLEGDCGDEGKQYRVWLEKNLPENIELDFLEGTAGVGGGMYDDDDFAEDCSSEANGWWQAFCES